MSDARSNAPIEDRSASRAPLLAAVVVVVLLVAGCVVAARHFGWFDRKVATAVESNGCGGWLGARIDGRLWAVVAPAPSSWPEPTVSTKVPGTARVDGDPARFTADVGGSVRLSGRYPVVSGCPQFGPVSDPTTSTRPPETSVQPGR